jgi:hypothetical protein
LGRSVRRAVLAGAAGVLLTIGHAGRAVPVRAAGELQGRELAPATDLETGLESLLGHLLGGQSPPAAGRIESAVVTEDGDSRLTVTVACSAGLEGRRVRGELIGRDRRSQRQIRTEPARLEAGMREVQLTFEPASGAVDLAESAFLRVSVDGGGPGLSRVFVLNKSWQGGSDSGDGSGPSLVRVQPRPEPLAAALPQLEPPPAPAAPPDRGTVPPPVVGHQPPVVRDHRTMPAGGTTRAPEVRDHRRTASTPAPAPAPASPQQRQALLARTASAVTALHADGRLLTLDPSRFQIPPTDQNRGAQGPNVMDAYDLLEDMAADAIDLDPSEVANIKPLVLRDKNPAAPFFYFLPQTYHLGWRADQRRYDMAMLYLAATTPASGGEVSMAAGLTAGIDQDEIRVVEQLLRAYCRSHSCPAAPQLRPFPIDPARVAVSLSGTLQLFNIPKDKVAPVGLSNALGSFQLAWVTDAVTKENVQLVMEQGGINGNVTFAPPGADQSGQLVDVQIRLADPGSFERAPWSRSEPWRNPAPYPVRLKYLHALVLGPDNRPTVYSWRLGDALVGPGGRVEWDASLVPDWVVRKALRTWVRFALVEDCDACRQQVMKAITAGVTSVAASQITFHTINPLASMGAYELAVRVRSRRFDPEGRETREKSIVLKADDQDFTVGPIYADEAGAGSGALFEYFLTVAMADGTQYEARSWIPSSDLRVLIGRSQIEKALGFVPGGKTAEGPAGGPRADGPAPGAPPR